MIVYVAATYAHSHWIFDAMDIYLAGNNGKGRIIDSTDIATEVMILESYVYARSNKHMMKLIPKFRKFILDSGAFTFMVQAQRKKVSLDWDSYIAEYAEFVNHFNVDHYFELDIDRIVGLREVERLRSRLEMLTGKPSIPVWHRSRGLDYWKAMIKDYGYISLSASGKNGSSEWVRTPAGIKVMRQLVDMANEEGVKVHGLGYTKIPVLRLIKFHSVDSSSWLMGNRGGYLSFFTGNNIVQKPKPPGTRMVTKATAQHNLLEWIKFQKYAETNL